MREKPCRLKLLGDTVEIADHLTGDDLLESHMREGPGELYLHYRVAQRCKTLADTDAVARHTVGRPEDQPAGSKHKNCKHGKDCKDLPSRRQVLEHGDWPRMVATRLQDHG